METIKKVWQEALREVLVWTFRASVIGIFFWLRAEFVTRDKYLEDQGKQILQWTELTRTLTHVDDVLTSLNKHDDDQEQRLRELEHPKK